VQHLAHRLVVVAKREHDDVGQRVEILLPQAADHLQPRHPLQLEVGNHDVGPQAAAEHDGFHSATRRLDDLDIAGAVQQGT
jgi:hypothetical protein